MDRRTFLELGAGLAGLVVPKFGGSEELFGDGASLTCEEIEKDEISQNYLVPVIFTGNEITEIIELDDKRERENKDPYHKANFALRGRLREKVLEKCDCFLFGNYLDGLAESMRRALDNHLEANPCTSDAAQIPDFECNIGFPENFLVDEMKLRMKISKADMKLYVYQKFGEGDILLLDTLVALGGRGKDYSTGQVRNFPTPSGQFYIKRINESPWWYPPNWAKEKKPKAPGPNNPYGLWMAELYRNNSPGGYDFYLPGDAKVRIHSTNRPLSVGTFSSHGCVRIHPDVAGDLFPALLYYLPHHPGVKNSRGTVYPLEKAIPIEIVEK
jgi:hypothetical protein